MSAASAASAAGGAAPLEATVAEISGPDGQAIGRGGGTVRLPDAFASPFRPDLIRRAHVIMDSHRFQPKGVHPTAGMDVSADSLDPPAGHGRSRVARIRGGGGGGRSGEAAEVASTRGGRQAHPPRAQKRIHKRINRAERRLALRSAISATAMRSVVEARGHRVPPGRALPIVVPDEVEGVSRAPDLAGVLGSLGLRDDVRRLAGRRARSGRPALRGRPKKAGKSVLFVVAGGEGGARGGAGGQEAKGDDKEGERQQQQRQGRAAQQLPLSRAAGSIPGVDVVRAADLSVLDLAPGSEPGRLVVYTPGALGELEGTTSRSLAGAVRARRRRPARAARAARAAGAPSGRGRPGAEAQGGRPEDGGGEGSA